MVPTLGLSTGSAMPSAATSAGADAATTAFKEITPQLLQAERAARSSRDNQDISRLTEPVTPYAIESGDVLSIVVWDHPELNNGLAPPASSPTNPSMAMPSAGFTVDHEGLIQFPYAGKVKVTGLTEEGARAMLASRLARYIRDPNITIRVQSFRSKRVYIDGEVKQPGVQPINDITMTLMEAINRAGGMLPSADQSRITLVRDGVSYPIDLPQLVQRGVNPSSIVLHNGDVLRIRSRDESKVFVSGEVVAPRALIMHNGRLSLNEALGEAGGINPLSGDASQVYVVRRSASEPVVYRLDAQAPGALAMAESFELDPKDLVYVAATPLTNWHRTISQIFPGALSSAVTAMTPVR
ncbi:polysaccharide biosynthesis/export family protein [Noviherbaspirillum soli]|uniref:polysaccharide biosynthesis/export family protein n=1 Tax=Noviherbaspirillum soli TaxID=1064518 RepID=UPI00188B892A|nr:polysaccharide biosynthesis/export family protein [Noviherbaspirillum soli]